MLKLDDALTQTLDSWCRAMVANDAAAAAELRDPEYLLVLPDGRRFTKQEELASIASSEYRVTSVSIDSVRVARDGRRATAVLKYAVEQRSPDATKRYEYLCTVDLQQRDGRWLALKASVKSGNAAAPPSRPRRSIRERVQGRLANLLHPSFQDLAYIPYMPGQDFALPKSPRRDVPAEGQELPVPPPHLWLTNNEHGNAHVDAMFSILDASGFALRPGDRVLDFGCGAGRMIRHLRSAAATCEVWGTDISAEHILWCKRNLSPPFHFATTTKVPHLPFEDRSFRLIYCGSVFTHIDDLADAWLLELRRILAPDGRLYVTIHDNHVVELLERSSEDAAWLDRVKKHKVFRESSGSFDMISIGRDDASQVFYDRDYFSGMVRPGFEVLSITPEAYFYQTAFLLKRTAT